MLVEGQTLFNGDEKTGNVRKAPHLTRYIQPSFFSFSFDPVGPLPNTLGAECILFTTRRSQSHSLGKSPRGSPCDKSYALVHTHIHLYIGVSAIWWQMGLQQTANIITYVIYRISYRIPDASRTSALVPGALLIFRPRMEIPGVPQK